MVWGVSCPVPRRGCAKRYETLGDLYQTAVIARFGPVGFCTVRGGLLYHFPPRRARGTPVNPALAALPAVVLFQLETQFTQHRQGRAHPRFAQIADHFGDQRRDRRQRRIPCRPPCRTDRNQLAAGIVPVGADMDVAGKLRVT